MQEATEEEQKHRRAEIDAEKEASRSLESKQRLQTEEQQRQLDAQAIYNQLADDEFKRKLDERAKQLEKNKKQLINIKKKHRKHIKKKEYRRNIKG